MFNLKCPSFLPPAPHYGPHQQQETLADVSVAEYWPSDWVGYSVGVVTL